MRTKPNSHGRFFAQQEFRFGRRLMIALRTSVFLSALTITTSAAAQSASFRSVDTNSDGVLSRDELIATFGERGARRLLDRSDHNQDGHLTIWELRRARSDRSDDSDDDRRKSRDDDDRDDDDDDDDSDDDSGSDDD